MVQSIEQLEAEKKRLLLRQRAGKALIDISNRKALRRRKLKAEIKALNNPGSLQAKSVARNIARRSGIILFKNAVALGRHLSTVAAEQNKPVRKKKKKSRRKR